MSAKRRSDGEGSIHRRKSDGRWVGEIQIGYDEKTGKPKRRYVYAPADAKRPEIVAKLDALRSKLRAEGALRMQASTVRDFFEDWLTQRAKKVRHRTHALEKHVWEAHIAPELGGRLLRGLDFAELQRFSRKLEASAVGARTRLQIHTTLSTALNDAVRWELITTNPMTNVDRPAYRTPEKTALTAQQARKLARVASSDRLGAAIVLALYTGLRQGEIFGLRWEDLDVARSTLAVRRSVGDVDGKPTVGELKNASSRRAVFLAPLAIEALEAHRKRMLREAHGSEFIFVQENGKLLQKSNFIRRTFHPLRDEAGIPPTITFHSLRHTCATLLLEAGVHPKIVADMLGHASVSITLDTYSHAVSPRLQENAAAELQKALAPTEEAPTRRTPTRKQPKR